MTTASPPARQRHSPRRQAATLPASYTTTGDTTGCVAGSLPELQAAQCFATISEAADYLADGWGETIIGAGANMDGSQVAAIFVGQHGTWTLVSIEAGQSCIFGAGTDWLYAQHSAR